MGTVIVSYEDVESQVRGATIKVFKERKTKQAKLIVTFLQKCRYESWIRAVLQCLIFHLNI